MGYKVRWVAAKNADLPILLNALALSEESVSHEPIYDSGLYGVNLSHGWALVIADGWEALAAIEPENVQTRRVGTESLEFSCDDTSMGSSIQAYCDGKEVWSLVHDGSAGRGAPAISGALPAVAQEVIHRLTSLQNPAASEDVDYLYDAPAEIGLALVGFRHDRTLGDGSVGPISRLVERSPR